MALSADYTSNLSFPLLRVIPYQIFSGSYNMALDTVLAQSTRPDNMPILRFYGWKPYCVSIGHHQNEKDLDLNEIRQAGCQAVRRPTGGSAIFHSEELTYAFIVPRKSYNQHKLYHFIHVCFAEALQNLGFAVTLQQEKLTDNYLKKGKSTFACFNRAAQSELRLHGKKLLGSAQKLYSDSILQHGSLLIGSRQNKIVRFLNKDDKEKTKIKNYLQEHSVSLHDITKKYVDPLLLSDAVIEVFGRYSNNQVYYQYPTPEEEKKALAQEKEFRLIR
ncbi:MAG TPA: hypothetical protein ENK44_15590 [Caldithrix abyssi]|uniref:BPL/LPL catalytic domain-containing protein n=1 Tax=Caldithrix abyssi TaxID=187145 RepID=A0A7V4U2Z5_CALAY|nr:hypothetical protein [Caldithrix abyssi]